MVLYTATDPHIHNHNWKQARAKQAQPCTTFLQLLGDNHLSYYDASNPESREEEMQFSYRHMPEAYICQHDQNISDEWAWDLLTCC